MPHRPRAGRASRARLGPGVRPSRTSRGRNDAARATATSAVIPRALPLITTTSPRSMHAARRCPIPGRRRDARRARADAGPSRSRPLPPGRGGAARRRAARRPTRASRTPVEVDRLAVDLGPFVPRRLGQPGQGPGRGIDRVRQALESERAVEPGDRHQHRAPARAMAAQRRARRADQPERPLDERGVDALRRGQHDQPRDPLGVLRERDLPASGSPGRDDLAASSDRSHGCRQRRADRR